CTWSFQIVTSNPATLRKQSSVRMVLNQSSRIVIFTSASPLQEGAALGGQSDHGAAGHAAMDNESAIVRLFPDRQARAGRPPGIQHLGIGTLTRRKPGKQVVHQT